VHNFRKMAYRLLFIIFSLLFIILPTRDIRQQEIDLPIPADTNAILTKYDAGTKTFLIDKYFQELCKKGGFNGTILVAQQGKIIYENAHGYSNYQNKDSLIVSSRFQLASVSKQFTATAIMILKDRGLLSYEDTVQKYYPNFPYKNVTIRLLLTHRSGIPNYMYFCDKYCNQDSIINNQDLMRIIEKFQPLKYFKPDKRYMYSNTGFAVLAAIVEKITKQKFADFMHDNVFKPLRMNNTLIIDAKNDSTYKNVTKGYSDSRWHAVPKFYQDGVVGDKGVYSTVEDLFKYDQALYEGKLIKDSTLLEAFKPSNRQVRGVKNYGFGWRILTFNNENKIVYHGGWWRGFNSLFMRQLNGHNTIIILTNKVNHSFLHNYSKLLEILNISSENDLSAQLSETEENSTAK